MSATYGWIIDRETVSNEKDETVAPAHRTKSRAGWVGPRDITPETEQQLRNGAGQQFRMYDDDGNLYYEGRYLGPNDETAFGPLTDLGTPDAGAVRIDYNEQGKVGDAMTTTAIKFSDLPHAQHFRVPNSLWGRLVIRVMRWYLGPQYRFVLRGRILDVRKARVYESERQARLAAKGTHLPKIRDYTDVQLRRILERGMPWRIAQEIGVYIKHTPKAEKLMAQWRAQRYEQNKVYEESRIARIVQERMAQAQSTARHWTPAESFVCTTCQQDVMANEAEAHARTCPGPQVPAAARATARTQVAIPQEPRRWRTTLYECEHQGDLDTYIAAMARVGIKLVGAGEIDEASESVAVEIVAPCQTLPELNALLDSVEVIHQ